MIIPSGLDARRRLGPDRAAWLDRLPALTGEVADDWQLTADGEPLPGSCSLIAPVRTATGGTAVLKVSLPGEDESEHEGLALQRWGGNGAVRLLRADPHRRSRRQHRLVDPR